MKRKTWFGNTAIAILGASLIVLAARPARAQWPGVAQTWGYNVSGQLGDSSYSDSAVPVKITGLTNVKAVAAGEDFTIALKRDGTVWATGAGLQLGDNTVGFNSNVPVQVSNLANITSIAAGACGAHSLALQSDGSVWVWGANTWGQYGNGTRVSSNVPIQVPNMSGVTAVAASLYNSYALKQDGTVWAWGANMTGQLGNGNNTISLVPVQVSNLSNVIAIAAGSFHAMAITSDGSLWTWGYNGCGMLGDGTTNDSNVPIRVAALSNVKGIAGGQYHSLAVTQDGTVYAWGWNYYGELGIGNTVDHYLPVPVTGLSDAAAVAAGYAHSMALMKDGTVCVWGWNGNGQLGDGTSANRTTAHTVSGQFSITSIAAGSYHSVVAGLSIPVQSISVTPGNTTVEYGTPVTFTVTASMRDGTTRDVSTDPATTYTVTHGLGSMKGNIYTSFHTEAAVIVVSYASGGVTAYTAAYVVETYQGHGPIASASLTPFKTTVTYPTPVTFTFTVTYKDGTTADVSTSPATQYSINHGVGALTGNSYASNHGEAAIISATYTEPGTGQYVTRVAYITENAPVTLKKIAVTPWFSTVAHGTPVPFTMTATYSDGSTKDVTLAPGASFSLNHGTGALVGNIYTSKQTEAAVILGTYVEAGITAMNVAYVNSN